MPLSYLFDSWGFWQGGPQKPVLNGVKSLLDCEAIAVGVNENNTRDFVQRWKQSKYLEGVILQNISTMLSIVSFFLKNQQNGKNMYTIVCIIFFLGSPENCNTLIETNIAPENTPLEKEIPIGNHHF